MFQFLLVSSFSSVFWWGAMFCPWTLCIYLSLLGFMGLKKHVMLLLLMLEFLSLFLLYVSFSMCVVDISSVMILMLLFTSVASEGAVSLALFLSSTRVSSEELTSLTI